jgi:hypothetical protein
MISWRLGLGLLASVVLSGCGTKYEGYNDVGRVDRQVSGAQGAQGESLYGFAVKYEGATANPNGSAGGKEGPSYDGLPFAEGDKVSIFLKTAFISYFPDGGLKARSSKSGWLPGFVRRTGEIAIIGNATLLSEAVNPGQGSRDVASKGRVVFYSDDVYPGQRLNFSYLPFAGPIEWQSTPLRIDLTVMELDSEDNAPVKAVLSKMSTLGSVAGLSGQAVDVLSALGNALVEGNKDDVMGAYSFFLMPESDSANVFVPVLRQGDYIIVRQDERSRGVNWRALSYDPATGMLYSCNDEEPPAGTPSGGQTATACPGAAKPATGFNYFVLTIQKGDWQAATTTVTLDQLNRQIVEGSTSGAAAEAIMGQLQAVETADKGKRLLRQAIYDLRHDLGGPASLHYKMTAALPYLFCSAFGYAQPGVDATSECGAYLYNTKPALSENEVADYFQTFSTLAKEKNLDLPKVVLELSELKTGMAAWADILAGTQ